MSTNERLKGNSELIILAALAERPKHGYDIFQWIREEAQGEFKFAPGMLYPLLHKLEKQKLITAEWVSSNRGPKRKEYAITKKGLRELAAQRKSWLAFSALITKLSKV
jgi:DNA-binding PadR family transcriptional regulator